MCRMTDDASDPARYFGREVRRARLAAGMTLAEFGRRVGYHHGQVSRVERGVRAPTEKFAQMCDKVFPERGGWFARFYRKAGSGPRPRRGSATGSSTSSARSTCRVWQPSSLSGLLQTEAYALAHAAHLPRRHRRADRRAALPPGWPARRSSPARSPPRRWRGSWSMRPRCAAAPERPDHGRPA